jgi:hypothetical protein
MADPLLMKRGDTAPAFRAQLLDGTTPVNLTGATAKLIVRRGTTVVINSAVTIEAGSDGWVSYAWQTADTAVADSHNGEVQVTWGNGTVQTFPASGYFSLVISEDLD